MASLLAVDVMALVVHFNLSVCHTLRQGRVCIIQHLMSAYLHCQNLLLQFRLSQSSMEAMPTTLCFLFILQHVFRPPA